MFEKKDSYDLTVWDSTDGMLRIIENHNGCPIYVDVDNEYDKEFQNNDKMEAYLQSVDAEYMGMDSPQDWGICQWECPK